MAKEKQKLSIKKVALIHSDHFLFLLYLSVMILVTFLQQEYVFLPQLTTLDIVSEESRLQILETFQRSRWISFLAIPVLLFMRLFLVSLCFYVGGFFFSGMGEKKFKDWWHISLIAQSVMVVYGVTLFVFNISVGSDITSRLTRYTSLLCLGGDNMDSWIRLPLSSINLFEVFYWVVMSLLIVRLCKTKIGKAFQFVMSTYGVGYFFYIAFLMFLQLYLS